MSVSGGRYGAYRSRSRSPLSTVSNLMLGNAAIAIPEDVRFLAVLPEQSREQNERFRREFDWVIEELDRRGLIKIVVTDEEDLVFRDPTTPGEFGMVRPLTRPAFYTVNEGVGTSSPNKRELRSFNAMEMTPNDLLDHIIETSFLETAKRGQQRMYDDMYETTY